MTSTTPTRIIAIALAGLAITAPVAGAMPIRDARPGAPKQDLRNPDQRAPAPPVAVTPVTVTKPAPVADNSGPSPLVYVIPSLVLAGMLGVAVLYARSSRRPARV
jgi:hypothetical protein